MGLDEDLPTTVMSKTDFTLIKYIHIYIFFANENRTGWWETKPELQENVPLFPDLLLHSLLLHSLLLFLLPHKAAQEGWGMGDYSQVHNSSLLLLPTHTFSFSNIGSPWATAPSEHVHLLHHHPLLGHSMVICTTVVFCRSTMFYHGTGRTVLGALGHLFPSFFFDLGMKHEAVSHTFPSFLTVVWCFVLSYPGCPQDGC